MDSNKMWIYSGLLIVVLAVMGVGIWLVTKPSDPVKIPDEDPIIVMDISYLEEGEQSQLSIYDDGTVIRWEDNGRETSSVTRTWRTGTVGTGDVEYLIDYMDSVGFDDLDEYLMPEALTSEGGTINIVDDYIKITVDADGLTNEVTVFGYFTPGEELTANLPDPVDRIYDELDDVVQNETKEVLTEDVTPD